MIDPTTLFSPVDILIGLGGIVIGGFASLAKFKNNPYRNMSIFLQVSLLIIKMAKQYYDTHPDKKERLNKQIADRLDHISTQLYEYTHGRKERVVSEPLG